MSRDRERTNRRPLPEALPGERGGQWSVIDDIGQPRTARHKMWVPLGASESDERARLHEMAHARWSPDSVPQDLGVRIPTLQAVEDVRMWSRLRDEIGVDLNEPSETSTLPIFKAMCETEKPDYSEITRRLTASAPLRGDWRERIETLVEAASTRENRDALHRCATVARKIGCEMMNTLHPTFENTVDLARQLDMYCEDIEEQERRRQERQREQNEREQQQQQQQQQREENGREESEQERAEREEREENEQLEMDARDGNMNHEPETIPETPGASWGLLARRRYPFSHRMPGKWVARAKRSSDCGSVPHRLHRYCIDQKVFSKKGKGPVSPTVLIDQSGSMHLDRSDLDAMCEAFPYATVAAYSEDLARTVDEGNRCVYGVAGQIVNAPRGWTRRHGTLRTLVERNRVAHDAAFVKHGTYNCCDGPALEWLAKQPEPRIWISDGGVNGFGGKRTAAMVMHVRNVCRDAQIYRVSDVEQAMRLMKHLARSRYAAAGFDVTDAALA